MCLLEILFNDSLNRAAAVTAFFFGHIQTLVGQLENIRGCDFVALFKNSDAQADGDLVALTVAFVHRKSGFAYIF